MVTPPRNQSSPPSSDDEAPETNEADDENDDISRYIPTYLGRMVIPYHGDFCVSAIFHPQLIVQLMAEGFLPMAVKTAASPQNSNGAASAGCLLLPKLHAKRSVIPLNPQSALHVSRSVRKKAKLYSLTLNTAWNQVVEYCQEQHGHSCWLYPPLVEAYLAIQRRQPMNATVSNSSSSTPTCNQQSHPRQQQQQQPHQNTSVASSHKVTVRMFSVEVWDNRTNELVAGELGYTVGNFMYTSLTGFCRQDSAGSVQLAAWGRYLQQKQFAIWDLGMDMAYKRQLGAQEWPRHEFVHFVHTHRVMPSGNDSSSATTNPLLASLQQPVSCHQILQAETTPSPTIETATTLSSAKPNSKQKQDRRSDNPAATNTSNELSRNGDSSNHDHMDSPCSKKRSRSSSKSSNGDDSVGNTAMVQI